MRLTIPSVLVLAMMTLAAMPPAAATHGDTAYLIGTDFPFFAESYWVDPGTGYLNQFWDFNLVGAVAGGFDHCPAMNGGWDPDPRPPPVGNPGPSGFRGTCASGTSFHTTGTDYYVPYPNPQGFDCVPSPSNTDCPPSVVVTYGEQVINARLIVCDNGRGHAARLSGTFCDDMLLTKSLV